MPWLKKKRANLIKEWLSDLNDIPQVPLDTNTLVVIIFSSLLSIWECLIVLSKPGRCTRGNQVRAIVQMPQSLLDKLINLCFGKRGGRYHSSRVISITVIWPSALNCGLLRNRLCVKHVTCSLHLFWGESVNWKWSKFFLVFTCINFYISVLKVSLFKCIITGHWCTNWNLFKLL